MRKILILQDMPLFPYRIYAYNELSKRGYDLTVVSVSKRDETYDICMNFKSVCLTYKQIGPFRKLNNLSQFEFGNYDVIIVDPNLRMLDYYQFYRSKYWDRLIGWGHHKGRTTGNKLAEWFRFWFFKKFRALVFYESQTRDEYLKKGFDKDRLFVANNTQYVDNSTVNLYEQRDSFIYVGRIQERKRVDMALDAFAVFLKKTKEENVKFKIVGGGDPSGLVAKVQDLGIDNYVEFEGPVHEEVKLAYYYNHAYAYISPGHVGLGVLHSLAFGVPVITCKGRKHSLEIINCNSENSFLVDFNKESISEAMYQLYADETLRKNMSKAAYNYYQENCTIDKMVDGVDDAIKYISRSK